MKLYVEKMISEREELKSKIVKAKKAIENPPYGMNKKQSLMLAEQVNAMNVYLECLTNRINYENDRK